MPDGTTKTVADLVDLFGFARLDSDAVQTIGGAIVQSGLSAWPPISEQLSPTSRVSLIPTVGAAPKDVAGVRGWWRWGRWVTFGLVSVVGGSLLSEVHRLPDPSTRGEIVSALLAGVLVEIGLIHLIGLGRRAWCNRRADPISYPAATYSPLVLVTAFAISVLAAGGAIVQRRQADTQAAIRSTGLNADQLSAAQNAFLAFQKAAVLCAAGPGKEFSTVYKRIVAAENAKQFSAVGADFAQLRTAAMRDRDCVNLIPGDAPELQDIVARLRHAASLTVEGATLYVNGFAPPVRQSLLDLADRKINEARAEVRGVITDSDALYRRLGGAALLGDRLTVPPGS